VSVVDLTLRSDSSVPPSDDVSKDTMYRGLTAMIASRNYRDGSCAN
jgi:hypothetical protein